MNRLLEGAIFGCIVAVFKLLQGVALRSEFDSFKFKQIDLLVKLWNLNFDTPRNWGNAIDKNNCR